MCAQCGGEGITHKYEHEHEHEHENTSSGHIYTCIHPSYLFFGFFQKPSDFQIIHHYALNLALQSAQFHLVLLHVLTIPVEERRAHFLVHSIQLPPVLRKPFLAFSSNPTPKQPMLLHLRHRVQGWRHYFQQAVFHLLQLFTADGARAKESLLELAGHKRVLLVL
jgi:hypothetical protein